MGDDGGLFASADWAGGRVRGHELPKACARAAAAPPHCNTVPSGSADKSANPALRVREPLATHTHSTVVTTSKHSSLETAGVFVIIGASGGIGRGIATALAADGAKLVLAGRSLDKLYPLADALGGTAHEVDASNFAEVEALLTEARDRHGSVAGVVNAVGSILLKPAHLTSEAELAETLRLNLQTAFAAVRAAARVMTERGSVLLFSSSAAEVGLPNHEAIAAAKGAVAGLVRSAAATYAPRKLRINALAPGLVATPLAARITGNPKSLEASIAMHPAGRIGTVDDIVAPARWLLDPASDWITGQVIALDGGMSRVRSAAR